jgi:hypothetical protein
MTQGARTPEELETLFEDATVIHDHDALFELFEADALLASGAACARGESIGPFMEGLWARNFTYVAQPRRVLQARGTALVIAQRAISVARRCADTRWRYTITDIDTRGTQP